MGCGSFARLSCAAVRATSHGIGHGLELDYGNPNYFLGPVADAALTQEILDIVQQASHYRQLKK